MALETLKNVTKIGGFGVRLVTDLIARSGEFITIDHNLNKIEFTLQNGPIKEHGVNGCQVDTLIEAAKLIIEGLNKQFPCRENAMIVTKLDEALMWSMKRKIDREARQVEGKSQA